MRISFETVFAGKGSRVIIGRLVSLTFSRKKHLQAVHYARQRNSVRGDSIKRGQTQNVGSKDDDGGISGISNEGYELNDMILQVHEVSW